jgi:putative membrane protein insertion efficiency factor
MPLVRDDVASAIERKNDLSGPQRLALAVLRIYKILISPMFAGSCRYLPSCSDYAAEAIHRFGVIRGSMLAAARLARCHPLGGHGVDAVPADNRNS